MQKCGTNGSTKRSSIANCRVLVSNPLPNIRFMKRAFACRLYRQARRVHIGCAVYLLHSTVLYAIWTRRQWRCIGHLPFHRSNPAPDRPQCESSFFISSCLSRELASFGIEERDRRRRRDEKRQCGKTSSLVCYVPDDDRPNKPLFDN